ncbi:MAG: hypothetical protein BWY82_02445 [Verrucomicrobia bacterium ADurb.Bin474]|nr:MAG: hypothetical protein BWY82_02445 [Verrucomicrobia bacterium ADurb.Bin474]
MKPELPLCESGCTACGFRPHNVNADRAVTFDKEVGPCIGHGRKQIMLPVICRIYSRIIGFDRPGMIHHQSGLDLPHELNVSQAVKRLRVFHPFTDRSILLLE